jgi:fructokinase
LLQFGSIASWTEPGGSRIGALVDELRGVLIAYDPNVRPTLLRDRGRGVEVVEGHVRRAHVVKASRDDLDWLYPDAELADVAARWCELGPVVVVVTEGGEGATAWRPGGKAVRRGALPVKVVDTIGAGDAFTAGLLTGLVRRGLHRAIGALSEPVLGEVLEEAMLVAAITCEREGADPPRADEL